VTATTATDIAIEPPHLLNSTMEVSATTAVAVELRVGAVV